MAWKKIVVSGSTAQLSTLNVDSSIEASTLSGSFSGSYVGNGSGLTNLTVSQTATAVSNFTSQTSVTTTHNFDTKNVNKKQAGFQGKENVNKVRDHPRFRLF